MASSLKTLHCETFDLTVQFDEKQFKTKEFLLDVKPKDKKLRSFGWAYGSKNNTDHAHLQISLQGEDSKLRLVYHPGKSEHPDIREPYVDDVAKWIGGFFLEKDLITQMSIIYKYGKQYKSTLQLYYPTLIPNELFKGALITGHQIDFPKESFLRTAIISASNNSTLIILNTALKVTFVDFDFRGAVDTFKAYANELVKKKGKENVKPNQKRKT